MTEIEWTDAEREALGNAMDPYAVGVLTQEEAENAILDALAELVAAREAQAAAQALREAVEKDAITIPDVLGYKVPAVAVEDLLNRADRIERVEP